MFSSSCKFIEKCTINLKKFCFQTISYDYIYFFYFSTDVEFFFVVISSLDIFPKVPFEQIELI